MSQHHEMVRDDGVAVGGGGLIMVGGAAGIAAKSRTQRPFAAAVTGTVFTLIVLLIFLMASTMAQAGSTTPVNLLTADSFAVLAGAGITNGGETTINGDVGTHPITSETGFGGCPALNCVNLTGTNHAGDSVTQGAKTDLITAYNQAASYSRTTIPTELGPSTPDQLVPGVYTSASTTFQITGTLTLDAGGDPNGVFIFYMGSVATSLSTSVGSHVVLQGEAQACNVFWVVAGTATLNGGAATATSFVGTIMAYAAITVGDNVTVDGRLLARTESVSLIHDTITRSDCAGGPGPTPGGTPGATPGNTPPPTSTLPGSGDIDGGPTDALLALLAVIGLLAAAAWLLERRRVNSRGAV